MLLKNACSVGDTHCQGISYTFRISDYLHWLWFYSPKFAGLMKYACLLSTSSEPSNVATYLILIKAAKSKSWFNLRHPIALFTDNILHLHYNEIEHECVAISGKNDKIARNCLVFTLNCIVMQISKVICEKGYWPPKSQYVFAPEPLNGRLLLLHCSVDWWSNLFWYGNIF